MNKKFNLAFYLITLFTFGFIGCFMIQKEKTSYIIPADHLLDAQGKPSAQLEELLNLLNIKHDGSLASIVTETQKHFLRTAGKERWQTPELFETHKTAILNHANSLGLVEEIVPTQKHYKYAIILGATVKRMRTRLAYLAHLWQQGIRFDHIICLGSERPLDSSIESPAVLMDEAEFGVQCKKYDENFEFPKTEYEAFKFLCDHCVQLPQDFKAIPITFINSLMIKNADGSTRRPTTGDTILDWLKQNPAHGDCLFISNQPYVGYQDSVMRTFMPHDFGIIESCGPRAFDSTRNSDILDTIARLLYQEKIRREKK